MSTRDSFYSITSIDPIRDVVASNDDALLEAFAEPEYREFMESVIKCKSPPKKEPGCWQYWIIALGPHLGVELDEDLPVNDDWKHYGTWEEYLKLVKKRVTKQTLASLNHLYIGRPLQGKEVEHDGCLFAWLTAEEVKELHAALSQLDESVITDEELLEFHEALVESLQIISTESKTLFLGAQ